MPRAYTVFADGRVVRWNGRSAGQGGVEEPRAAQTALDSLWIAATRVAPEAGTPVVGPQVFLDIDRAGTVTRHAYRAGGEADRPFVDALRACWAASASGAR